jgi:hypothetical protein
MFALAIASCDRQSLISSTVSMRSLLQLTAVYLYDTASTTVALVVSSMAAEHSGIACALA